MPRSQQTRHQNAAKRLSVLARFSCFVKVRGLLPSYLVYQKGNGELVQGRDNDLVYIPLRQEETAGVLVLSRQALCDMRCQGCGDGSAYLMIINFV